MSTRSNIAYENPKGEIVSTYCHSDGYLAWNGMMLYKHYNSYISAIKLVDGGYISSIDADGVDRHHSDIPDKFNNEYHYMSSMQGNTSIEYIYLYKNDQWYFSKQKWIDNLDDGYISYTSYYTGFKPLKEHLDDGEKD